jgi:hypothetical protein
MECVTTVNYSAHFNNMLLNSFKPSCGLRQGDPLSPYLFLLVADGLSRILQHEVISGALHELKICRHTPSISHLLFADDTLFFLEVSEQQAGVVHRALKRYERCTGQLINSSKCSIMFGTGCMHLEREKVKEIMGVDTVVVDEKYLGLPTPEGRITKDKFKSTKEKMVSKFTNWVERNMSAGAKEVLIKSVAQAIPVYIMGIFRLSRTLCNEMTQLIRYFWWGEKAGQRKIHWIAWDKLLVPKGRGGMGFRDL